MQIAIGGTISLSLLWSYDLFLRMGVTLLLSLLITLLLTYYMLVMHKVGGYPNYMVMGLIFCSGCMTSYWIPNLLLFLWDAFLRHSHTLHFLWILNGFMMFVYPKLIRIYQEASILNDSILVADWVAFSGLGCLLLLHFLRTGYLYLLCTTLPFTSFLFMILTLSGLLSMFTLILLLNQWVAHLLIPKLLFCHLVMIAFQTMVYPMFYTSVHDQCGHDYTIYPILFLFGVYVLLSYAFIVPFPSDKHWITNWRFKRCFYEIAFHGMMNVWSISSLLVYVTLQSPPIDILSSAIITSCVFLIYFLRLIWIIIEAPKSSDPSCRP